MTLYRTLARWCHQLERHLADRHFHRRIAQNHNLAVEVEQAEYTNRIHKDGWVNDYSREEAEEVAQTTLGKAVEEYGAGCLCSHCFASWRYEPYNS